MKSKFLKITLLSTLLLFGCKKYFVTPAHDDFSGTKYNYLGSWSANGLPNYLVNPSDSIPAGMTTLINTVLPEGTDATKTHPELFAASNAANLVITKKTQVFITFAHDGSGNFNSLGFYSYPTNNPPVTASAISGITIVFPDSKAPGKMGALPLGSKVNIGTYEAGTSIGFVILAAGWLPANSSVSTGTVHFASADALNPETDPAVRRHAVLLNYQDKTLICFKDTDRQSTNTDNDFNDVIIYCTQVAL